jgi:putative flavoprotein involved in K+ transport
VPALAERLDPGVVQLHSSRYHGPQDVPAGPVLVVGGGNTGYQIAEELARIHKVHLSIGGRQTPLPQRILGRDLFRYLEATGLMGKTAESRIGQRMQHRETLIGSSPRAARRRHGIELRGRTDDVSDQASQVRGWTASVSGTDTDLELSEHGALAACEADTGGKGELAARTACSPADG